MSEQAPAQKIEKEDILLPELMPGETSIVFQRHGKYNRDPSAENAGSISQDSASELYVYDKAQFDKLFAQDDAYVLFVSSDTQYAGKGYRSLETAQVAQDAAVESLENAGLNPSERILNFNPDFKIAPHLETFQAIRPLAGIREPQIFNPRDGEYLNHLQETHGYADLESKTGLAPEAWDAHEQDSEKEVRETTDAESEDELINRTKKTLAILEKYARVWHASNPDRRLVIWAASHYDTLSPLVKEVDGVLRNEDGTLSNAFQPIDYGGGVVINIPQSSEDDVTLARRASERLLELGHTAAARHLIGKDITSPTKLGQTKY
jgi:hypothetical protein